jgi:microsomal dipeptidase-like Zn-dependent dipeptidase
MIVDLHAHYPMHVVTELDSTATLDRMTRTGGRASLGDRARAAIVKVARILLSDRDLWSGYRITVEGLERGGVGVALSVLYRPFSEMDFDVPYGSPPQHGYFDGLLADLEQVEAEVGRHDPATIRMVHDGPELEAALADGAVGVVHVVEGGFHLGGAPEEIERNVAELARRGVAYVTLAHLFFRDVATNAPAIPFLPDRLYALLFPQKPGEGLTELGRAAVRAMVRHRVMVDVAHMRPDALEETFALLDELDPDRTLPVLASHAGYRFGGQEYMLDAAAVRRIEARGGVVGLILAQHQLNDGIRRKDTKTLAESLEVIQRHVDALHDVNGSHDHIALGTDFDGFIKPTMGGLESAGDLAGLEAGLRRRYGNGVAEQITSGNALRVLRRLYALRAATP